MLICFDLSYRYRFLASIIAPWLLALIYTVLGFSPIYSGNPILRSTCIIYYPCLQHIDILIYSNSQLEVDTLYCFLLPYITSLLNNIASQLDILLRSFMFAQSISEYSDSILGSYTLRYTSLVGLNQFPNSPKHIFCLIVDLKYLLISFTALSCFFARSRNCWLSCPTQKAMSGRVYTIVYIILPIAL